MQIGVSKIKLSLIRRVLNSNARRLSLIEKRFKQAEVMYLQLT
jgi:hypothetical protein